MKLKLPLIAAFVGVLALTACGGSDDAPQPVVSPGPTALVKTDVAIGTGAEATAGKVATVNYTGYLYSSTATGNKGAQFDTSVGKTPLKFTVGSPDLIAGFDQGTLGMKVGGKRTVLIPAALGYGARAQAGIPANSGLVFDIELVAVQ